MKNEAAFVSKLKDETVLRVPPPVVWTKHNDGSTSGVADISVVGAGQTWWVEAKYVRVKSTTRREVTKHPLQLARMKLKWQASGGRAVYVVFHEAGPTTEIWTPHALDGLFQMEAVGSPVPPALDPDSTIGRTLDLHGGVRVKGHDYGLLARLIRERP
jgi:ABC-type proline/glycine betaine transport system substrate-binding protein